MPHFAHRTCLSALACGVLVWTACSAAAPQRPRIIEVETARFDGVHYPVPDSLPILVQPPPSPPEDPRLASTAPVAPSNLELPVAGPDLHNAALRDHETEYLTRQYLRWVEQLYRIVRQMSSGGGMADPLSLRKWHGDNVSEMGALIEDAAALEGAFVDLAQLTGIDLAGSSQEPGRPGRVRLLFRLTACVRRDLAERTRDGLDYLDARRRGLDDAELRATMRSSPERIDKQTEDLIRQTSATLACAQLAGRAMGRE